MNEITYQNQELLSPKSDLVFKALFGQESSKDILMSFLNSVLDLNITSEDNITLPNTERIGEQPANKSSRLDVCVTVKKRGWPHGTHRH